MECNDGIHKGLYDMGMVTCEICNEDIGSIAYSLILDYQFCACVMRISGGTIHLEINFSSKVYSKSLLRGLHEAKPIDLYFDAG